MHEEFYPYMTIKKKLPLLFLSFIIAASLLQSCSDDKTLPILGHKEVLASGDTLYHKIPKFSFINQDSVFITNKTYEGKIYVSDFFFTACPTICPQMAAQLLRIYKKYEDNDQVMILSHSIDPVRDSVPRLKDYASKLGVSSDKWSFVTGIRTEIYDIAEDYFSIAMEDDEAPGGFNHSGRIILIDWNGHIRSFCDGTDTGEVNGLMKDIDKLIKEYRETIENQ